MRYVNLASKNPLQWKDNYTETNGLKSSKSLITLLWNLLLQNPSSLTNKLGNIPWIFCIQIIGGFMVSISCEILNIINNESAM